MQSWQQEVSSDSSRMVTEHAPLRNITQEWAEA